MTIKCPKCNHAFEYNICEDIDPAIELRIKKYNVSCDKKFKEEHPCPKCGSHNVDIDWATPMWCNDCGHRW